MAIRLFRVASTTLALVLTASLLASPASADGPDRVLTEDQVLRLSATPASSQHVSSVGDPAGESSVAIVADQIRRLSTESGFAGLTVDAARSSINLYYKGGLEPQLAKFVSSSPLGVSIETHTDARFSRLEAMRLLDVIVATPAITEALQMTYGSVNPEGSGIKIGVKTETPPSDEVVSRIMAPLGLEGSVTFEVGTRPFALKAGRQADAPAWKGGARIKFTGGIWGCSSGFNVLAGSTGFMLTAYHCDATTGRINSGTMVQISPNGAASNIASIDSKRFDPSASPATVGKIYVGSWSSTTLAAVKNWSGNNVGDPVCQSGATSGTRCGTIINDATVAPGLPGKYFIHAKATSGWMVADADSGGPVYRSLSTGVQARGIVYSGAGALVTCGSLAPDVTPLYNTCNKELIYVPISVVLNTWGMALETS